MDDELLTDPLLESDEELPEPEELLLLEVALEESDELVDESDELLELDDVLPPGTFSIRTPTCLSFMASVRTSVPVL